MTVLKRTLCLIIFSSFIANALSAQEAGLFKGSIEFGPIIGPNLGAAISIEPKYNLTQKSNVGIRLELPGFNGRDVSLDSPDDYTIGDSGFGGFFVATTYEYYFGKTGSAFQPFVGGGFGYFRMNGEVELFDRQEQQNLISATSRGTIGALAKLGFEWGKFRYGFAFTYVPDTDLVLADGSIIGQSRDYYVHFYIGLTVFGGKWKKVQ
jgi:hypothetical protein